MQIADNSQKLSTEMETANTQTHTHGKCLEPDGAKGLIFGEPGCTYLDMNMNIWPRPRYNMEQTHGEIFAMATLVFLMNAIIIIIININIRTHAKVKHRSNPNHPPPYSIHPKSHFLVDDDIYA